VSLGLVVWITGLPSSGKSTLARATRAALRARGRAAVLLDGDEVRASLVPAPGYDDDGRAAFYETLTRLAVLLAGQGMDVLVAATAHRRTIRDAARRAAGDRFVEVHVATSIEECRRRDDKGLYAASLRGAVVTLPGPGADYEPPARPEIVARGGEDTNALAEIVERVLSGASRRP
jgi:adenylylsulfate kinase